MSIQFNDTTNYKGLVQFFEKETDQQRGAVSGDTDLLKEFAADVNVALDDFVQMAILYSGTWQWDDSNQTDYPIITTNLVSGQRDYAFTTDGSGNMILDIYKVLVADTNGIYTEINPRDVQSERDTSSFSDGRNATGIPLYYDKTANAIFLDPIPNYNSNGGLKLYINRESGYFTYTDTTKKAGIPGILQSYLFLKPAYAFATRNSLAAAGGRLRNGAFTGLALRVNDLEQKIQDYFSQRVRDERRRLTISSGNFTNSRFSNDSNK